MKKPLGLGGQGSFETILQQNSVIRQLVKQIRCHNLTDCLIILENSGYTGNTAIFFIANIQALEART